MSENPFNIKNTISHVVSKQLMIYHRPFKIYLNNDIQKTQENKRRAKIPIPVKPKP